MFSPNNKYIISIGCKYDMIVNVWDWRNSLKIASSKVSTVIKAIDISESGKHFITVGNRLVKFWYLQASNISKVASWNQRPCKVGYHYADIINN